MWRITWDDVTFDESELTVAHLNAICLVQGSDKWEHCNPLGGPGRALGVLAVVVALAEGRRVDDVIAEVARRPAIDLLNAFSVVDDDEPPESQPAPIPSTPNVPRPAKVKKKRPTLA